MNPGTCLAAILVKQHKELVLDRIELPKYLDYGQVLVKLSYSGICGSQIGEIDGVKGEDSYLPHLLGHEGSGVILDTGPGVKFVQSGDHVVMHWRKGQGIEARPPVYQWKNQPLNAGWLTTFNEYAVVSENRVTKIPENFNLKTAMLFGCAVTTGFGVAMNDAEVKIGESVVVFGIGGVGLNIVQAASMTSAYPVIAVDLYSQKLEMAKYFGATHILNATENDSEAHIKELLKNGADVVIDTTGNPKIIELAFNLTGSQGRTILVGVPKKGDDISIYSLPLHFGKKITGSHGGNSRPAVDIPRYIRLYESGELLLDEMITEVFKLSEINIAIEKMRNGKIIGRTLIDMNL